ncbi:hypothetical protein B0H16DRAFT_1757105 [Mycena metata]|uniref:Extracellular membrane protein CFEM domain-containing protein n=1 Tax=Mycena metata TaxID=1033252 RepID=A0AAD7NUJ8_9AGAR|nr:hypothetical protein B0H16DRAFT_1757105 [Mycena metata]
MPSNPSLHVAMATSPISRRPLYFKRELRERTSYDTSRQTRGVEPQAASRFWNITEGGGVPWTVPSRPPPEPLTGPTTGSAPSTSGSGTPGAADLSPCALGCIQAAAAASACGSLRVPPSLPFLFISTAITKAACVCTDANFQSQAGTSLQAECKPAEAQAALAANAANCGPLSLTPTASATVTAPFLPSNTAADISASGSGSGASPSGSSPSGSNGTNSTSPSATGSGGNGTSTNKPSGAAPALLGNGFAGLVGAAVVAVLAGVVV